MMVGMPAKKHHVALELSEEKILVDTTRKGRHSAREITRAKALLMANENGLNQNDDQIATQLRITSRTVQNIRKRYCQLGIDSIKERPRPGRPPVLTEREEASIVATACTDPPSGHDTWTLDLLAEHTLAKRSTIYRTCLKNQLKPWHKKNVVHT